MIKREIVSNSSVQPQSEIGGLGGKKKTHMMEATS